MEVAARGIPDADEVVCAGHNLKFNPVNLPSRSARTNLSLEVGRLQDAGRHGAAHLLLLQLRPQPVHQLLHFSCRLFCFAGSSTDHLKAPDLVLEK